MRSPLPARLLLLLACPGLAAALWADRHVAVNAVASPGYEQQRRGPDGKIRTETYVFTPGHCFEGATADRSLERMPFRRIAEFLAPELARRNYLPSKDPKTADLLLVVHWGATIPHVASQEMRGETTTEFTSPESAAAGGATDADPTNTGDFTQDLMNSVGGSETDRALEYQGLERMAEQTAGDLTSGSNLALLGYARHLHKLGRGLLVGPEMDTLRADLVGERYFLIVCAYDLRAPATPAPRRRLWTLYVNMRSPGTNFTEAVGRMSTAAADFFGRTTDRVETVRPKLREGRVELGDLIILGEAK